MRKLPALSKLYHRPPTNEDIERDYHKALYQADVALQELRDLVSAMYEDGLLEMARGEPAEVLGHLEGLISWIHEQPEPEDDEVDLSPVAA